MKSGSGLVGLMVQIILLYAATTKADPRSNIIMVECNKQREHNVTAYVRNFLNATERILSKFRNGPNRSAVSVEGSGPDATYVLAQCYGDLSQLDCALCYTESRMLVSQCFPGNGGRIVLDGCFLRGENYSFFDQIYGPPDRVNCSNSIRKSDVFAGLTQRVMDQMVLEASETGTGFSSMKMAEGNESVYGLANCWRTVNASRCRECLANASAAVRGCLPGSEGRAIYTGCFLRYSDSDFLNHYPTGASIGRVPNAMLIIVVVSSIVIVTAAIAMGSYLWKQKRVELKRKANAVKLEPGLLNSNLHFSYSTLELATENFSTKRKLGQGGYGTVYKGVLADGREVAVKRLFFNNKHRVTDFYNEVNMVSTVEHKNLVRLLGCSCTGPESLLVYEYIPNQSLDRFIFDPEQGKLLNWEKRMNIIIGTAEGLVYLHENCENRIVHRDIKASNILLDSKFRAKIADFGLAKSFEDDKSHITTAIAGTLGYMPPEYLAYGQLTEKADVYSFGILLIEIVSGVQNSRNVENDYTENVIYSAWRHFQSGTVNQMVDPNLMVENDAHENGMVAEEAQRVVHVGLLGTQEAPALRPSMKRALEMLSRLDECLPAPSHPPFLDEEKMELSDSFDSCSRPLNASSSAASASSSGFHPR